MIKLLLDANAYDFVAADAQLKAEIASLQESGLLEVVFTHVERSELQLVPLSRQIGQSKAVKGRAVHTAVFVWGKSFWGHGRFGTPETRELYRKLQGEIQRIPKTQ